MLPKTLLLGTLVPVLFLSSCATAGGAGRSLRVTYRDFSSQQRFELVSTTHTDPVVYYSTRREDASRKIQSDEAMHALVRELESAGFEDYGSAGNGPSRGSTAITRGLELERDGEARHWVVGPGSPADERVAFNECTFSFLQLYNITQALQAVENEQGAEVFERDGGAHR